MTHGDVDQKNILLVDCAPRLCDWDVAALLDALQTDRLWKVVGKPCEVVGIGGEDGQTCSCSDGSDVAIDDVACLSSAQEEPDVMGVLGFEGHDFTTPQQPTELGLTR